MKMRRLPVTKRVQQIRSLSGLWKHRRVFSRMLRDMMKGAYKASFLTIIAIVVALLYIVSPIDFLPDIIPIVGWTDDGIVFYFLLKRLMKELDRYEASRVRVVDLVKRG